MQKQLFKSEKDALEAMNILKGILGGEIIIDKSMKSSVLVLEDSDKNKKNQKIGFYINNHDTNYEIMAYAYTAD